jgi:hypothetical protein
MSKGNNKIKKDTTYAKNLSNRPKLTYLHIYVLIRIFNIYIIIFQAHINLLEYYCKTKRATSCY